MRVAVYARLSAKSDDEANIPQQLENGRAAVRRRGWTLVGEYVDDGVSAWREGATRPDFQRLLGDARDGKVDVIVVREVDRLTRNPGDWGDLSRTGAQIATHGGEILDRFAITILAGVATKESDVRSTRQLLAEDRRINEGKPPRGGHRHFGYSRSHEVVVEEATVIREMTTRWLDGETLYALTRELNERAIKTTRGNEWTYRSLKKLMQSPRLAGIRVHRRNGEVTEHRGTWEPIISEELHRKLATADSLHRTARAPKRYILTGLLVCGRNDCGSSLNGKMHREGSRRYHCLKCQRNGIAAEPVEDWLWNEALGRVWDADRHAEQRLVGRLAEVESTLQRMAQRLQELDDAWWQNGGVLVDEEGSEMPLSKATYVRQGVALREQVENLEAEARQLQAERDNERNFWTSMMAMADHYDDATDDEKRILLRRGVSRVVLAPAGGGKGGVVDLDRLDVTWAVPRSRS